MGSYYPNNDSSLLLAICPMYFISRTVWISITIASISPTSFAAYAMAPVLVPSQDGLC